MRCNYCGWNDNAPGQTTCSNCHRPLIQDNYQSFAPNSSPASFDDEDTKKTRVFNGMAHPSAPHYEHAQQPTVMQNVGGLPYQPVFRCPDCDEEIRGDYAFCPFCGKVLREQEQAEPAGKLSGVRYVPQEPNVCQNCGKEVPIEYPHCPFCGTRIEQKTITVNRIRQKVEEPKPHCKLTMIFEDNEEQKEEVVREFEGPQVVLKRSNTEANNRTITTKEQALLSYEDGHWAIENRSKLDSTFVAASHKIALEPGDIIMLGDRCFRFEPEPVHQEGDDDDDDE